MDKIVEWFRARKKAHNESMARRAQAARANLAVERFNIIDFHGSPVISLDGIVISVPNEKVSGDALIKQLMELRKIYSED